MTSYEVTYFSKQNISNVHLHDSDVNKSTVELPVVADGFSVNVTFLSTSSLYLFVLSPVYMYKTWKNTYMKKTYIKKKNKK